MSSPTREQIFGALFALAPAVSWGAPAQSFAYTSRRVKLWDDLPDQPALCQAEHEETIQQATRLPYRRQFNAAWMVFHTAGKDRSAVPASTSNAILDAIEAAFAPAPADPGYLDGRNTLNGLVHHCWINGKVFKDPGDLDGQALLIVPISLLVP